MVLRLIAFLGSLAIAALSESFPGSAPPRPWLWAATLGPGTIALRWLGRDGRTTRSQVLILWAALAVTLLPLGWARWALVDLGWQGRPLLAMAWLLVPLGILSLGLRGGIRLLAVLAVVPAAALLASEAAWSLPIVAELVQCSVSLQVLALTLLVLLSLPLAPLLVVAAVPSEPFPAGEMRERLLGRARELGVALRDLRVFGPQSRWQLNACAVGFLRGTQRVFFTRGLLTVLAARHIEAVFSHEVAHFARRHFGAYGQLLLGFLLSLAPLLLATEALSETVRGVILLAYTACVWFPLQAIVSRRLETDADLTAAQLVGFDSYASTLEHTASVLGTPSSAGGGLRHGSLASREALVRDCSRHPETLEAQRLGRLRLDRLILGLLILCVSAFLACAATESQRSAPELAAARGEAALARAAALLPALDAARQQGMVRSPLARNAGAIAAEIHLHLERARLHLQHALPGAAAAPEQGRASQAPAVRSP